MHSNIELGSEPESDENIEEKHEFEQEWNDETYPTGYPLFLLDSFKKHSKINKEDLYVHMYDNIISGVELIGFPFIKDELFYVGNRDKEITSGIEIMVIDEFLSDQIRNLAQNGRLAAVMGTLSISRENQEQILLVVASCKSIHGQQLTSFLNWAKKQSKFNTLYYQTNKSLPNTWWNKEPKSNFSKDPGMTFAEWVLANSRYKQFTNFLNEINLTTWSQLASRATSGGKAYKDLIKILQAKMKPDVLKEFMDDAMVAYKKYGTY